VLNFSREDQTVNVPFSENGEWTDLFSRFLLPDNLWLVSMTRITGHWFVRILLWITAATSKGNSSVSDCSPD